MKIKAPIVYQIDVVQLRKNQQETFDVQTSEEVMNVVERECVGDIVVYVDAKSFYFERGGHWVSFGEFIIWSNGQRATLRINEHQSFVAFSKSSQSECEDAVWFLDEEPTSVWKFEQTSSPNVSKFSVPFNETFSLGQAMEVLKFWLPNQEKFPLLEWRFA